MRKQGIVTTVAALLFAGANVHAEDGVESRDDPAAESGIVDQLYDNTPSRWRVTESVNVGVMAAGYSSPLAEIAFQDNSTVGRLSRLRNLSLLTLGRMGKSRLFIGVNDDGLVGLHFNALSGESDGRYLEMARMPYLKASKADDTRP